METTEYKKLIEPTKENIQVTLEKIAKYAQERGFVMEGVLALPKNIMFLSKKPDYESRRQMKLIRSYCTRLNERVTMGTANRFLHTLFKKVYKEDKAPRVEYSAQELNIREARKLWKKAQAESDRLLIDYKNIKGDFYKKR